MRRSSFVASSICLALLSAAACARPDSTPAKNVAAAGGDVVAAPSGASSAAQAVAPAVPATAPASGALAAGLTDSLSTRADVGRIRGAAAAPVWLVEVSDFQCPYCKEFHDKSFAAIDREYVQTGKVRLAYLNFPLSSIHPNARAAAEAAMCASAQGHFWELHESLFISQQKWAAMREPMPLFDSLAVSAGVNAPAWRSCMTTHAASAIIEADRARSRDAGVQSTPTFFVGEQKIEGAAPLQAFRAALDSAIAKAGRAK